MRKPLKFMALSISALLVLALLMFIVNQVGQLFTLASAVSPVLGQVVLWGSILLFGALLATPIVAYLRLPKALVPPRNPEKLPAYKQRLAQKLARNPQVQKASISTQSPEGLTQALDLLKQKADEEIDRTAKAVFLTTAVSQNGKLDALTVLAAHMRLVWRIAHLYHQRPGLKQLAYLYGNVAGTALITPGIEDLDISEQLEPIMQAMARNSAGSALSINSAGQMVIDSLFEGTVNALLTLRIGIVARNYCGLTEPLNRKVLRKNVLAEASARLGGLVMKTSGQVVTGVIKATGRVGVNTVKNGARAVANTATQVANSASQLAGNIFKRKGKASAEEAAQAEAAEDWEAPGTAETAADSTGPKPQGPTT